jgi:hypothetical protein
MQMATVLEWQPLRMAEDQQGAQIDELYNKVAAPPQAGRDLEGVMVKKCQ